MRYAIVGLLCVAACATGPNKLVDRAIEAAGGLEALESVQGYELVAEGTYQGMPYKSMTWWRGPYDWTWKLDAGPMQMRSWLVGEDQRAWTDMSGALVEQTGAQATATRDMFRIGAGAMFPQMLRAGGVRLSRTDHHVIGDKRYPALIAQWEDSKPVTYIFDRRSKLVVRVLFTALNTETGEEMAAVMDLGDYRDVGGVLTAHKWDMVMGEGDAKIILDEKATSITWNPEFAEGLFEPKEPTAAQPGDETPLQPAPDVQVKEVAESLFAGYVFVGPYDQVAGGIQTVADWIAEHGMEVTGPVTLVYKDPPPADMSAAKTYIQVPVKTDKRPKGGDVTLRKMKGFQFAFVPYAGPASGCYTMFPVLEQWLPGSGYKRTGHFRVHYLTWDEETQSCTAEIGFPVRTK